MNVSTLAEGFDSSQFLIQLGFYVDVIREAQHWDIDPYDHTGLSGVNN